MMIGARPSDGSSSNSTLWTSGERAPKRQHLLFAAREQTRRLVAARAEHGEPFVHGVDVGRDVAIATHIGAQEQVLLHGRFRKHAPSFGNVRDAEPRDAVRRQLVDASAEKRDLASNRLQ